MNLAALAAFGRTMDSLLIVATVLATLQAPRAPDPAELRDALKALRDGHPGEAAFEAALPRLPDLLASDDERFLDGAAYLVAVHGRGECAEEVVEALRRFHARAEGRSRRTLGHLLDASIRLGRAAPAEVLLARADHDLATELFLALAQQADPAQAADGFARFVELGWTARPAYWAAALELTGALDPRIAAHWFGGTAWELRIAVRDPGADVELHGSRFGGGWTTSHGIWPPAVQYDLDLPSRSDPWSGYAFERTEHERSGPHPETLPEDETIAWRGLLLDLLVESASGSDAARPPPLGLEAATAYVERDDARSLELAARAHVAKARERLAAAALELARAGLLADAAKSTVALRFHVTLHDLRADRTEPLPAIAPFEGVVVVPR